MRPQYIKQLRAELPWLRPMSRAPAPHSSSHATPEQVQVRGTQVATLEGLVAQQGATGGSNFSDYGSLSSKLDGEKTFSLMSCTVFQSTLFWGLNISITLNRYYKPCHLPPNCLIFFPSKKHFKRYLLNVFHVQGTFQSFKRYKKGNSNKIIVIANTQSIY